MDSIALLSVVGVAVLLSIIFVSSLCIDCWRSKQPISIHQRTSDSSPEYNPTAGFVVRHPQSTYAPHPDHHRITTIPYQLPNSLSSPSMTAVKAPSCPPSETGSQASYVNQHDSEDEPYVQPPDEPDNNYIIVIADSPNRTSRASSHSSGENYINVENEDATKSSCDTRAGRNDSDSDCPDYENFKDNLHIGNQTPALSYGSINSDDRGSSDYVNTDPHAS
ncbi:linker for activation of T-cells family member 1 [Triplophysa rosa]|uniref:Linker for activation of T cells n=1 Tax=Triplophysa rosa TaxID=992332 RepID=A0A9W7WIP6_TRIRA|nr:linker for activation of T-cells family member 1 [Triplophysa rosa]KAI7803267.1 putative linker for activation of T cells [Triplophysa rosa]